MSFAFNIPFKVERGESMKTIKVTIGNASSNMLLWSDEIERLAASAGLKNGIVWYSGSSSPRYNLPIACALLNGLVVGKGSTNTAYRFRSNPILVPSAANYDADSRVGDEYTIAVTDCPWFE